MSWDDRHGERANISMKEAEKMAEGILEYHGKYKGCGRPIHESHCAVHSYSGRTNECNCTPKVAVCNLCMIAKMTLETSRGG